MTHTNQSAFLFPPTNPFQMIKILSPAEMIASNAEQAHWHAHAHWKELPSCELGLRAPQQQPSSWVVSLAFALYTLKTSSLSERERPLVNFQEMTS